MTRFAFPVGYHQLHHDTHINFELNRGISLGYARLEDMQEVAPKIRGFEDWKREMIGIAEKALSENRLLNASYYYRLEEFFTSPGDPDKIPLYDKFIDLFYTALEGEEMERLTVPYGDSFLPAIHRSPESKGGVVVIHGGYDSFIEEFYSVATAVVDRGYEVIMFEGPGQGAALKRHGLVLTPEWEKPVSAVLDHFELQDVTLVGVSLGGYLALRAAAFEPRIARVVAYDVLYDFLQCGIERGGFLTRLLGKLVLGLIVRGKALSWFERTLKKKMETNPMTSWAYIHGMYVTGMDTVYDLILHLRQYSAAEISSLVTQDVLLLAGEEDHMVPLKMYYKQKKALKNARSVTGRIFTREEHAENHCQIGNIGLAINVIIDWIKILESNTLQDSGVP